MGSEMPEKFIPCFLATFHEDTCIFHMKMDVPLSIDIFLGDFYKVL